MAFKPLGCFISCWSCDLIPQKYPVDIGIQRSNSLTALQVLQPQAPIIVWERTLTQFSATLSPCSKRISCCISFHPEPRELQWGKRFIPWLLAVGTLLTPLLLAWSVPMDLECHQDGQRSKAKFFWSSSLQIVVLSPLHSNSTLVGGRIFPGDSVVKNPPPKQETWVQSLGQEDPLQKEMATHSNILA